MGMRDDWPTNNINQWFQDGTAKLKPIESPILEQVGWDMGSRAQMFFQEGWVRGQVGGPTIAGEYPPEWGKLIGHDMISWRDPEQWKVILTFQYAKATYLFKEFGDPTMEVREDFKRSSLGIIWWGE